MTGTDHDWEQWGRRDPYFGVITDARFRLAALTDADREHFFATGRVHVEWILDTIRRRLDPGFAPRSALDFGCGVGRVVLPLAAQVDTVIGVDVSPSMLAEARRNLAGAGVGNIELVCAGDASVLAGKVFDLVHSVIVLQHIDPERGTLIFRQLVELMGPRSVGVLHVTYGKSFHPDTLGVPPPSPAPPPPPQERRRSFLRRVPEPAVTVPEPMPDPSSDPPMMMNSYPLNPLLYLVQTAGVHATHVEFTDHGGELGLILFFQKP
jgi:SAM-dependent methyltransferase